MGRLPFYVDLDYQVLKHHPGLLEYVMKQVPWDLLSQFVAFLGWLRVVWIIAARSTNQRHSKVGDDSRNKCEKNTQIPGQLSDLEIKLKIILERTEADIKEKIVAAALEAALHIESNDPAAAALVLATDITNVCVLNLTLSTARHHAAASCCCSSARRWRPGAASVDDKAIDSNAIAAVEASSA
eukprot:symbB.v1.2.038444.t1/scaffold5987.1/size21932/4